MKRNGDGTWAVPQRVLWGFVSAIVFLLITTALGWKGKLDAERLDNIKAQVKENRAAVRLNTEFRIDTARRIENIERQVNAIASKLGVIDPPQIGGSQ